MHPPYTLDFAGAFASCQAGAGLVLALLVLFVRFRSVAARAAMMTGIILAVGAESVGRIEALVGLASTPAAFRVVLMLAAACATATAALVGQRRHVLFCVAGQFALWLVSGYVADCARELCALHLAWLGLTAGILVRTDNHRFVVSSGESDRLMRADDGVVFALATLLASLVCILVMHRREGTADEWAYTFQAAAFAKGQAYASSPPCASAFRNFYVYDVSGRLFSQYTPGWPLFMAPFVKAGATWLSGPIAFGLMVVGVSRLARSVTKADCRGELRPSPGVVRAAGIWAAVLVTFGTMTLINAASRYSHIFVAGLYAWTLESLVQVSTRGGDARVKWGWGMVLGISASWMLATRPADGALLGLGIAAMFSVDLLGRRIDIPTMAYSLVSLAIGIGITLGILRMQLGAWFKTGYSIGEVIYPWSKIRYSFPGPSDWKYGLPLATGSYCWWPASVPVAMFGLATVRGRARATVVALAIGFAAFVGYLECVNLGHGENWGYGPRYVLPIVVPLSVGGAIALAPLSVGAGARTLVARFSFQRFAPLVIAIVGFVSVWLSVVPKEWATVMDHTKRHAALSTAISRAHLKNAIVLFPQGLTGFDPKDLTKNLPIDLYPNQDVLIAIDRSEETEVCLRNAFPARQVYSATGVGDDVVIAPF